MTQEQRLDRVERMLLLVVKAGARERKAIRKGMAETRGGLKETDEKINALIDAQIRTEDEMARLARAQAETSESLKALIVTVDRIANERGNGKA